MITNIDGFQWDFGNLAKCSKHGLGLQEIEAFFSTEFQVFTDYKRWHKESRFVAVGYGLKNRPTLIVFAIRIVEGLTLIRPISARYMHKKEADKYEKATTKI